MHRSVTLVAMVVVLAGVACEDGPDQTFSPAPPNAASIWNGADAGPIVGISSQSFDASTSGGQNANTRCNAVTAKNTWSKYFSEPIAPPGLGGGLDIAGGPTGDGSSGYAGAATAYSYQPNSESWAGATVLQAENLLCQGTYINIYYGVTNTLSWGENNEFGVLYNSDNLSITDLLFQTGYAGTFNATSRDGTTTYSINLTNEPITKTVKGGGSSQIILNWNDPAALAAIVNELYDAYIATYAPTFPSDVGQPGGCIGTGHCEFQNNGSGGGNVTFTPLNATFFTGTTVGTPQEVSIISLIDLGKLKILPFSTAAVQLQLDSAGVGPFALATNVSGTTKTCKYALGMAYSDFDSNCVQVFDATADGGAASNIVEEKKLLNSIAHDNETYDFDVIGVDPQFSATLTPTTIVSDTQRPSGKDTAIILNVDQDLVGPIANDYVNNDTTKAKDLHGIGLVTLEWAYLVQQYMKANYGVTADLGDAACIKNPSAPGGAKVCSGLEGIVTSAPPALVPATMKVNAIGANAANVDPNLQLGLKPQTWFSVFCATSGAADGTGYSNCIGGNNTYQGYPSYYFDTMQDAVALAFGTNPIPAQLADRRFFFEEWMLALIKYLETADKPNTPLVAAAGSPSIDSNPVDPNELFFDSAGGGFENAEYVFRDLVNPLKQEPTTLTITTNLLTSLINNFQLERFLYRSEKELYEVLTTTKGDLPGSENLLLSNLVGSSVLASTYGTYACAINQDPTPTNACGGVVAPVDLFGNPLYAPYAAAFGQSFLHIAAANAAFTPSPMVVDSAPYQFIASAMVTIPVWSNPYDPTTAAGGNTKVSALANFFPQSEYVGFPVLIDGSRDKFYSTYEVDIPGTSSFGSTVQGNVDFEYEPVATGDGGTENALVVRAVETPNYLGLVFACAEPSPTVDGVTDVLAVRMYDNADVILDWIAAHNATGDPVDDCSIYFKQSVYGNYFDYISFNQSGVRFGLNPGYGGSVVSDVTIFDPNVIAGLGQ
jgi:hypothetical protein